MCQPSSSGLQRFQRFSSDEDDEISQQQLPRSTNSSLLPPPFPEFLLSGLPGHLSVDWHGAEHYLKNLLTLVKKSNLLQNTYFVKSLHAVKVQNHIVKCNCPRNIATQGLTFISSFFLNVHPFFECASFFITM